MSLTVIHKDTQRKTALIKNNETQRSFPVILQDWLRFLVCVGDIAIINRTVSGEWIMTYYIRNIDNIGEDL